MPITKNYNLNELERKAIEHYKSESSTVEEFLETNNIDQSKLDAYVSNYISTKVESLMPLARGIAVATDDQMSQIAPLITQAKMILGVE